MNRAQLVKRYLELQDEGARMGIYGMPHITRDMTDDEMIRRGMMLAERIKRTKQDNDKASKQ